MTATAPQQPATATEIPLWDVWEFFLQNYFHTNSERWLATTVAEAKRISPLSPSPFTWGRGAIYRSQEIVPESRKQSILTDWCGQYQNFLGQMSPRPST